MEEATDNDASHQYVTEQGLFPRENQPRVSSRAVFASSPSFPLDDPHCEEKRLTDAPQLARTVLTSTSVGVVTLLLQLASVSG